MLLLPEGDLHQKGFEGMKTTIDGFEAVHVSREAPARREWTAGSIVKIVVAITLLTLVYLLASWIPVEKAADAGHLIRGFLLFWVLGGMFTVAVLVLSDLRT
jgi:Cu/Ag efflux pump CusA